MKKIRYDYFTILMVLFASILIVGCNSDDSDPIDEDPIEQEEPADEEPADEDPVDEDPVDDNPDGEVEDVIHDEQEDGDLSNDNTAPSAFTLSLGSNRLRAGQRGDPRDIDYITITIGDGNQLSEIILDDFLAEEDNLAFIGIVEGNTFPVDVAAGTNPEPSALLGGLIYGAADVGMNILSDIGAFDGVQGFTPPLPAGSYTIWLNQTGPNSEVQLNFVIEEVETTSGSTIFDGPVISFTKSPNANFTMAANQDFITNNVIITRGNTMGLFNIAQEDGFAPGMRNSPSPAGTEWAVGSIGDDLNSLSFGTWGNTVGNPNTAVANGTSYVVHLIEDDIFLSVIFTQWSQGSEGGGGFSYERTTAQE
ncbi:MAG: hypothetical protein AAF039_03375 [Bacteroidota bacterium]